MHRESLARAGTAYGALRLALSPAQADRRAHRTDLRATARTDQPLMLD